MTCYSTFTLAGCRDDPPLWLADAAERFAQKYSVDAKTGCWIWRGAGSGTGYGSLGVNGVQVAAHRFAYELLCGPVPPRLVLDHLCRNRGCVNPAHVEPVTQGENVRRGLTGQNNSAKTRCPYEHEYTAENTYILPRSGSRVCRTCQKRRRREYVERRRSQTAGPSGG